jgi:hypothetical protein
VGQRLPIVTATLALSISVRGVTSAIVAGIQRARNTDFAITDGTIDTTRTLYLGNDPAPEVKRAYTRVLQGHIAVSVAEFPEGMSSDWFNMLARQPLYA